MQRIRIGLTGLASVFLLVLLAAVFSRASDEEPITANAIQEVATANSAPPSNAAALTDEPLAELGVAPGNAESDANETSAETVPVEDPLRPQRLR